MTYLRDNSFLKSLLQFLPITFLFIAVLNEFDANYFGIPFLTDCNSYVVNLSIFTFLGTLYVSAQLIASFFSIECSVLNLDCNDVRMLFCDKISVIEIDKNIFL